ncbi:hypothetical protein [Leeuwenhoekiella aequorea]|uniref:Uncharacterized protein n=1 Tax=Leeuwenhoekiella aequorea TaxID=283736 RepID=A0A4V1KRB2_9FLAO|nr:hypothetical protein [Leeuwenhoekiella aequorea]AOE06013.1 hypothetical protein [uncultured bacterium]RXG24302.1 hypothetical protein DSM00_88 [Leeuwenhoekiella aequorea]
MSQKHLVALLVEEFKNLETQSKKFDYNASRIVKASNDIDTKYVDFQKLLDKPILINLEPFENSKEEYIKVISKINNSLVEQAEETVKKIKSNKINQRIYLIIILLMLTCFASVLIISYFSDKDLKEQIDIEKQKNRYLINRQNQFFKEYPDVQELYEKWNENI